MVTSHLSALLQRYPALAQCDAELHAAREILIRAFERGHKLLVCGNGGSAADCEHLVAELMKGFQKPRRISAEDAAQLSESGALGASLAQKLQGALPAISLVSHSSLISAVLNDTAGDMVFAQQVYGLGKSGDVLLAISTSGNSGNVLHAVTVAKTFGLRTIALTGRSGGAIASMVDCAIRVPADCVAEIQEFHLPVYHWLAIELERRFFA